MPETPDFDQIARRLTTALGFSGYGSPPDTIRTALVGVWNARGAADIAKLEEEIESPDWIGVERALRPLDR